MLELFNPNTAKEFLTFAEYFDDELIDCLPDDLVRGITDLAADSFLNYRVDANRPLLEQKITEECMNLLRTFYFLYRADYNQQAVLLKKWTEGGEN